MTNMGAVTGTWERIRLCPCLCVAWTAVWQCGTVVPHQIWVLASTTPPLTTCGTSAVLNLPCSLGSMCIKWDDGPTYLIRILCG